MMPEKFLTVSTVLLSSRLEFSVQEILFLLEEKDIGPSEYKNVMIDNRESWDRDFDCDGFVVVHHKQIENPNFEVEMEVFNRENEEELRREADRKREGRIQEEAVRARKAFKDLRRQQRVAEKACGRNLHIT